MPFDLPTSDQISALIGLPGIKMVQAGQQTQQTQQTMDRATAAYNALKNIYGPVVGNLNYEQMQSALNQKSATAARDALLPGQLTAQGDTHAAAQQSLSQNEQAFPYKLAGAQADINSKQETTTKTQLGNQQTDQALQARQALFGLQQIKMAITNGADPEAAFTAVAPAIAKALGRDPTDIIRLGQAFKTNPEALTLFEQQLGQIAAPLNGAVLTPEGMQTAAGIYSRTGVLPAVGQGKAATAVRTSIINNAAAGGATGESVVQSKNDVAAQKTYLADLAKSGPGTAGGLVRSAGAVLSHIDVLDQYINALENGNVKAANSLSQTWKEQTGKPAPVQFDAQKTIVTDELTRYLIARGGGVHDRQAMQEQVSRANSPAQLRAVIQTWKSDMVGQLEAQRQHASSFGAEKQFEAAMTPRARELLSGHGAAAAAQYKEGAVYQDKSGHRARYQGGKFVPVQ